MDETGRINLSTSVPRPPSISSASSVASSVPPMLKFRRSNIWQWERKPEERNAMEVVNKAIQKKAKINGMLGQTSPVVADKKKHKKKHYLKKVKHHHHRSQKPRNNKGSTMRNKNNKTAKPEKLSEEDLEQRKLKERERLRKLFLKSEHTHVRAQSRLPFKTTTPSMTPAIPYDDENQLATLGKVLIKRNSYESLDAVPQYNRLIQTYFKWSQMPNRPNTPRTEYLAACEEEKILPERLDGIIRLKKAGPVNISHYGMGPKLQKALAKGLHFSDNMYDVRLNNNRINDVNGAEILKALPESLLKLDISKNIFGPKSIVSFINNIRNWNRFRISILNLSGNMIKAKGCQTLFDGLLDLNITTLQRLNLSHNDIGNEMNVKQLGKSIARFLKLQDQKLIELDLSWNRIRGLEALDVIKGMVGNKSVGKFNFAWNGLGSSSRQKTGAPEHPYRKIMAAKAAKKAGKKKKGGKKKKKTGGKKKKGKGKKGGKSKKPPKEKLPPWPLPKVNLDIKSDHEESVFVIDAIGDLLEKNQTIQLLDLSYNNFDADTIGVFNEKLKNNHTLLEIRLKGLNVEIDSCGFLNANTGNVKDIIKAQYHVEEKSMKKSNNNDVIPGAKSYRSGAWIDHAWPTEVYDTQYPNGWISGGWDEIKISFSPSTYYATKESEELGTWDDIEDVYIRFEIDGWKPIKMQKVWDTDNNNKRMRNSSSRASAINSPNNNKNSSGADAKKKKRSNRNGYCSFETVRILPPGKNFFCFSLKFDENDEEESIVPSTLPCLSSEYNTWNRNENVFEKYATLPQCKHNFFETELTRLESVEKTLCPKCNTPFRYEDLEFNHSINVSTTNYIIVQKRIGPLVLTKQFPRIRVGGPNNLSNTGFVGWTVRTSIFAPRLLESTTFNLLNDSDVYDDCAKIDFQSFRLSDDVKDKRERRIIFDCVQSYYLELVDVFTYQALQSTTPNIFVMDLQSFISWINTLEDLDNQYSEDNIRALWNKAKQYGEVATKRHANERQNFDDNEEHKDPIGCICRRHFIALLVRVAIDRYFVHGEESSAVDAVRHFLINVVFKTSFVPNINGDEFRQSKLYTSDCDHILKRFYMEIKSLFSIYSTTVTTELGSVHYIVTFEKAMQLAHEMTLFNIDDVTEEGVNRFHERMESIRIAYVSSLLLIDDEERVDATLRHSLSLVGFLEYISRLALLEKLDLRLAKERVVVKGRRHGNVVPENFYEIDFIDKLERFLKAYVLEILSRQKRGDGGDGGEGE